MPNVPPNGVQARRVSEGSCAPRCLSREVVRFASPSGGVEPPGNSLVRESPGRFGNRKDSRDHAEKVQRTKPSLTFRAGMRIGLWGIETAQYNQSPDDFFGRTTFSNTKQRKYEEFYEFSEKWIKKNLNERRVVILFVRRRRKDHRISGICVSQKTCVPHFARNTRISHFTDIHPNPTPFQSTRSWIHQDKILRSRVYTRECFSVIRAAAFPLHRAD